MKPRFKDIALSAGVSPATVSNVFHRRKGVSAQVAAHVREVARQMGYEGEPAAPPEPAPMRALRFVMYKRHGLVIMDTPFFAELIQGIEQACRAAGYELIISTLNRSDPGGEACIARMTADAATPIMLLGTEMSDDDLKPFCGCAAPLMVLDRDCSALGLNCATLDNFGAGYAAGELLMARGHLRIGFLDSSQPFYNCTQRRFGLECALRERGLSLAAADRIALEPTLEGARRDMLAHMEARREPLPTALFAMNDIVAIGASRALKHLGYRLPNELSIVGMDDMPPAAIVSPALTTLNVDKAEYGRAAAERLLGALGRTGEPRRPATLVAQVALIERASVAAPRQTL